MLHCVDSFQYFFVTNLNETTPTLLYLKFYRLSSTFFYLKLMSISIFLKSMHAKGTNFSHVNELKNFQVGENDPSMFS